MVRFEHSASLLVVVVTAAIKVSSSTASSSTEAMTLETTKKETPDDKGTLGLDDGPFVHRLNIDPEVRSRSLRTRKTKYDLRQPPPDRELDPTPDRRLKNVVAQVVPNRNKNNDDGEDVDVGILRSGGRILSDPDCSGYRDPIDVSGSGFQTLILNCQLLGFDMRYDCSNMSCWDTSRVTDMTGAFTGQSFFNSNINKWDVSNVSDFSLMFSACLSFNQPLNLWDTGSAQSMSTMFMFATSFNQSLNSWNIGKVTSLSSSFYGATSFNQPLNSWNTMSVTSMSNAFRDATSFNRPLNSWTTASVTDLNGAFRSASAFNQPMDSWDISSATDLSEIFRYATNFNQCLSTWHTKMGTGIPYGNMLAGSGCPYQVPQEGIGPWCQNVIQCPAATMAPSDRPSVGPTDNPTFAPSDQPSDKPSETPTDLPTEPAGPPPWHPCGNNPGTFQNSKGASFSCGDLASGKKNWDSVCASALWQEHCPGLCDKDTCPCSDFEESFTENQRSMTCSGLGKAARSRCHWCRTGEVCRGTCRKVCKALLSSR